MTDYVLCSCSANSLVEKERFMSHLSSLSPVDFMLTTAGMARGQRLRFEERRPNRQKPGTDREWGSAQHFSDLPNRVSRRIAQGGRGVKVLV